MNIYPFYDCMELGDVYVGVSNEIKEKYSQDRLGNYSYKTANEKRWIHHKKKSYPIDIKCYPFLCKTEDQFRTYEREQSKSIMNIYEADRKILSIDLEQHLNNNLTTLLQDPIPLDKEDQIFTYRTDSILIVFGKATYLKEKDKIDNFEFYDILIFSKYPLKDLKIKNK